MTATSSLLSVFVFLLVLAGCSSTPRYSSPSPTTPSQPPIKRIPDKSSGNTLSDGIAITQKASLGVTVANHVMKKGAYVLDFDAVSGASPAEAGGVQKYDLITLLGSCDISDISSYLRCLDNMKPYDVVKINLDRDGKTFSGHIRLGGRK
jgi:S1-C subfamily serine protease